MSRFINFHNQLVLSSTIRSIKLTQTFPVYAVLGCPNEQIKNKYIEDHFKLPYYNDVFHRLYTYNNLMLSIGMMKDHLKEYNGQYEDFYVTHIGKYHITIEDKNGGKTVNHYDNISHILSDVNVALRVLLDDKKQ